MTTLSTPMQERFSLPGPARGAGGGDRGGAPTAGDLWGMLRRRTVLIAVLFVLFTMLVLGGFLAWYRFFPGFRGECLIECISNIPETTLTVEQQRLKQEDLERFAMTQALLLKSPSILGDVLKVTAIRDTDWYKTVKRRGQEHLIELTDDLSASPVRGTNFLRVAMETRIRTDAALIINEVVGQWYASVRRKSAEEFAAKSIEDAQSEESALAKQIEEKRNTLKAMAVRLPAGASLNPANNITAQQVAQYGGQVAQLTLELSQLEQYRDIYNDSAGVAVTAEDRTLIEQDLQVAELARNVFLLEQQLAADGKVYGPEHKAVRQLNAQLSAASDSLSSLREQRLIEVRNNNREAANTAYANNQHSLFLAQENLAKAEAELQDQDLLLFNYHNLEAELQQDIDYQLQLTTYIKSRTRVVRQQTAVNVNIAQPAIDPLEQSSPSLMLIPLGIFLALGLSVSIAVGLELMDTSVRTSQDVIRHLDVAMLGAVPDTDDEEVAIERVETAVRDHPRSMIAEAFRRIRTNLQFCAPAERQRTVLVTSPVPEDGKTSVACNLAIALAQGGRHVLLIDANFRRPSLHKVFEKVPPGGLSNILIDDGTLEGLTVKTTISRLEVLGAGRVPPNPAELLGGEALRALLTQAASRYDQVVLDTAPVLLASDALVLASFVDGVILVVRANANSRGVARRACGLLGDVGAHLFGAVLNAAQVTRGGYFREQLRAYYDYQTDAEEGDSGAAIVPRTPMTPSP